MPYLQNIHTHSIYCDGKNTPRELVLEACRLGMTGIGLSTHTKCFYSNYPLPPNGVAEGHAEIERLKREFKGQIEIFNGIEYDMYCGTDTAPFDFVIGAVHYLKMGDGYFGIDVDRATMKTIINERFGGDGVALAEEYYRQIATMPQHVAADVVAHFDIIAKHCEGEPLFDMTSKRYLDAALEAVHALVPKIPIFEVSTGAITRGYRTAPYPTLPILKEIRAAGGGVIISSDCHDLRYLTNAFDVALDVIEAAGFSEVQILTDTGFAPVPILRCK